MKKTLEDFQREYDCLFKWRSLWTRLANRRKTTGSEYAIFLSTLQTRDERIQRRAGIANGKIGALLAEIKEWNLDRRNNL